MSLLESLISVNRDFVGKLLAMAEKRLETGGPPPLALDCTAGNGHDTLFLAQAVGPRGAVLSFDVQEKAIAATKARLEQTGLSSRVRLARAGHETLSLLLPEAKPECVDVAMFNLGFLPGGNRTLITRPETTLAALRALLPRIRPGGAYSVHCYAGHAGGTQETRDVALWFQTLPWRFWRVFRQEFVNKTKNQEVLFLAERLAAPTTSVFRGPAHRQESSVVR